MISRWSPLTIKIAFSILLVWSLLLNGNDGTLWAAKAESGQAASLEDEYELQQLLVDTIDQVERNYVKDISRRELIEAAIEGVLRKLDPYSTYISPEKLDSFRTSVEHEFGGIGVQIRMSGEKLIVTSPLAGTPGYEAGLLAGDRILAIDKTPVKGLTLSDVVDRLKGKPGTEVTLAVLHPMETEPDTIPIVRRQIQVDTVLGDSRESDDSWNYLLDQESRIGYLRLTAFSRTTADELRRALDQLKRENAPGLILDMRFNPGGLLRAAIEVSDLFLSEGRIVSTSGRNTKPHQWDARAEGTFDPLPIVVLVNRYTASAAEIVAAALQDHDRAVIMGERTWGKGSVQNVISLEDGKSMLKLTTSSYQRPSGKNIHRFPDDDEDDPWGVVPDDRFAYQANTTELIAMIKHRRQRDVIANRQTGRETDSEATKAPNVPATRSTLEIDRLLKQAYDYLNEKIER